MLKSRINGIKEKCLEMHNMYQKTNIYFSKRYYNQYVLTLWSKIGRLLKKSLFSGILFVFQQFLFKK